ncbi:MAG: hypothetical protein ACFFA8_10585 [Promethearchaeota archaeon]
MQIIHHLGEILSIKIGISAAASRGLIRLAIKEEFGPFTPLSKLNLRDYQKLIQNSLKRRLQVLDLENYKKIVDFLLKELLENQSLITMEKV